MSVAQAVMMSVMAGTYSKARREELASFLRSRRDRNHSRRLTTLRVLAVTSTGVRTR